MRLKILLSSTLIAGSLFSSIGAAATAAHAEAMVDVAVDTSPVLHGPCDIVHPCMNYGFKKAMKTPEVVIGFVNHTLNLQGDEKVTSVTYLDGELSSDELLYRDFTIEVLCQVSKGERFLLEIQNDFRKDYTERAFVELSRLVSRWQVKSTRKEATEAARAHHESSASLSEVKIFGRSIHKAMFIAITNKKLPSPAETTRFPGQSLMEPEIINVYKMAHRKDPTRPLGDLDVGVVLVMLSRFEKEESELETDLDRWLFAFKEPRLSSKARPIPIYKHIHDQEKVTADTAGLRMFYQQLNRANQDRDRLRRYEEDIIRFNEVMQERSASDRAEGRAEGEKTANLKTAKKMIVDNMAIGQVLKYAKLSLENIERLKAEYTEIKVRYTDRDAEELAAEVHRWIESSSEEDVAAAAEADIEEGAAAGGGGGGGGGGSEGAESYSNTTRGTKRKATSDASS